MAFVSGTEQEDHCVCVLDLATDSVTRVGPGYRDGRPVWSPDGKRLAFPSHREGGLGIVIAEADGSGHEPLEHARSWNERPAWSPRGSRIAYIGGEGAERLVVVQDLASGEETVWGDEGEKGFLSAVWLDEDALVAVKLKEEAGRLSTGLFRVSKTNVSEISLPQGEGKAYAEWAPKPHPSGLGLAFESNDGGDREIFILLFKQGFAMDATNHHAADWNPVWSPDGKWIGFESFRGGRRGLYRVDPERLLVQALAAPGDADCWDMTWSPDMRWVVYVSNKTGNPDLFLADLEGTTVTQLTTNPGLDCAPAWRPEEMK